MIDTGKFKVEVDGKGNKYRKWYLDCPAKAILCQERVNRLWEVRPNFAFRHGESKFGIEGIIQFKMDRFEEEYASSSKWDNHVELYLQPKEAVQMAKSIVRLSELDENQRFL